MLVLHDKPPQILSGGRVDAGREGVEKAKVFVLPFPLIKAKGKCLSLKEVSISYISTFITYLCIYFAFMKCSCVEVIFATIVTLAYQVELHA